MDKYLDIKNCSIDKLVLACEDEILNATENSLDDKKITLKKKYPFHSHDFISNCLLVIINCYFYWLLLLLYRILEKTKRFITILHHK